MIRIAVTRISSRPDTEPVDPHSTRRAQPKLERRQSSGEREPMVLCAGCDRPVFILKGEEPRQLCAECEPLVVRRVRQVLSNRERQRRFRVRRRNNAPAEISVTLSVGVVRPNRIARGSEVVATLRDRTDPPEPEAPRVAPKEPGVCGCGRSLNLGRYKTGGDTCGTCKREAARAEKARLPAYVSSWDELERQLNDPTPIEGDPVSEHVPDDE